MLGVSDRRVRVLCAEGRIPGAQQVGSVWILPDDIKVMEATRKRPSIIDFAKPKPKPKRAPRKRQGK